MKRILITGGAGFIGSHLCERLLAKGHKVIVYDDLSSGSLANLKGVKDKVQLIQDDIINITQYAERLKDLDVIYHLAARISGYDSLSEADEYIATNLTGLKRVLDVAKESQGCHIVFASSSTVYGNQPSADMHEHTPPNPLTMYALTKLSGEHILSIYHELYGFTYNCARLFNVYGPRQSPDHPYANVTCKFSHAAATDGNVKLYGTGRQTRDFVYVEDVVDALMLLENPETSHRIYNVGTGKDASIRDLLDYVAEIRGEQMNVEQLPPWPNDISAIRAKTDRIQKDLNYTAKVSLAEGLRNTVEFFKN